MVLREGGGGGSDFSVKGTEVFDGKLEFNP